MILKVLQSKFYLIALLVLISLLFTLPLFKDGYYSSHDGEVHIARFGAYIKGFLDGQFPVRWAGDLNYSYGSPVLNFFYPLPSLISIPLYFLGLPLENTFKIIVGFSFIFSFVSFYLWAREFIKKEAALAGALLYGLAPYHFLNLYVRGDVGELLAFSLIPLVFLFIDKTIKRNNIIFVVLGSVFYGLLILSHNSVSLMFSLIFLIYAYIKAENLKQFILSSLLLAVGLMFSSFFWAPALVESSFTNARLFIGDNFKDHFLSLERLIFSDWGYGPDVNKEGGLSPHIGILNFLLIPISLYLLLKKRIKMLVFWTFIFLVSILFTLVVSAPIWNNITLLKLFEFPWRFLGISSFALAIAGAFVFSELNNKKVTYIFCIFLLAASVFYVKVNEIPPKPDKFYFDYRETTYHHGEASPIWTAGDFSSIPESNFEIIEGNGEILEGSKKSNLHEFTVNAKTDLTILDNTVYFPGWRAEVDGEKVPIEFQNQNHRGLITFKVPEGMHKVLISFGESPVRLVSNYTSLLGIFLISLALLLRKRINKILE